VKARRGQAAQQLLPPPAPARKPNRRQARQTAPAAAAGGDPGFTAAARGPQQMALLARIGLWTCVVSGPLLGLMALAAHSAPAKATASAAAPANTTAAAGVAELYLQSFLSAGQGTEGAVRAYYPAYPDQSQQPDQREAEAVDVISSSANSPGVVTVELAAHVVAAASGGGWTDEGWHFYQVPMAQTQGAAAGYLALTLPAEVQAPAALAEEPNNNYSDDDAEVTGTPLSSAVSQFLAAYLTGQGVVSRYTVPGSSLAAVSPAPYASVTLTQLSTDASSQVDAATTVPAAGTVRHVLASVTVTDSAGHSYQLSYPLVLQSVAGQWEVASLAPSPDLAAAPSAALATPGAASSSSAGPATSSSATSTSSATPSTSASAAAGLTGTSNTTP
jgi:hypothetical protein